MLSAPFALPATLELPYSNIGAIESGMFNVRLNLVPISELLATTPRLDLTAANPPMPNNLGQAQIAAALLGVLVALAALRRRGALRAMGAALLGVAGLLVLALLLMAPVSAPLWDVLPLARFIAFPWRLLGPALLFAALLGAAPLAALPLRAQAPALGLGTLAVILLVAPYLFPRTFAPVSEPSPAGLWEYERRSGARGTASANEYLPRWVADPNPPPLAGARRVAAGAAARGRRRGASRALFPGASIPGDAAGAGAGRAVAVLLPGLERPGGRAAGRRGPGRAARAAGGLCCRRASTICRCATPAHRCSAAARLPA